MKHLLVIFIIMIGSMVPQQLPAAPSTDEIIKKLSDVEIKIRDLQEEEKVLKDFIDASKDPNLILYTVGNTILPIDKANLPKLVGFMVKNGFDQRQAKDIIKGIDQSIKGTKKVKEWLPKELDRVQQELVNMYSERDDLRRQLNQTVWVLKDVILNPHNITLGEQSGDDTWSFEILARNSCQIHRKKINGTEVVYDCTFTFTFPNIPAVVAMDKPIDIPVTATAGGKLAGALTGQPVVFSGGREITYKGQGDDKTCWVGDAGKEKKTSNKGIYQIKPQSNNYSGFSIELGASSSSAPFAFSYEYVQLQGSNQ